MAINWSEFGGFDWVIVSQFGDFDTAAHDLIGHIQVYLPVDNGILKTPSSIQDVQNWKNMQLWLTNYDEEEIDTVGFYFNTSDGSVHNEWTKQDEDYPNLPTISDFFTYYADLADKNWDKRWNCAISARTDEYEWAELFIQKVVA